MRKRIVLGVALTLAVFTGPAAHANYTAVVDPAAQQQTLEGWGTSLCWWANVAGGFPQTVQDDYLNKIFDPKLGLGMNIVRYNIGGGENPNIRQTMEVRARVPGFEPSSGVWDWSADASQRRILLEAMKKGVNLEEAFANSPPWWMTMDGTVTGGPNGGANLKPEDFQAFADYLTTVAQHYHDAWGVTFRTLEPMNESANHWWTQGGHQEGYHLDARNAQNADQNALVKDVASDLKKQNSATVVSASDDNAIDTTLASVGAYDPEAQGDVGQINTHTYGGSKRAELAALAEKLGRRVWVSEHGDGDATGMTMSHDILADFKQMGCTAWVYWQAIDGGGWGMMVKDMNDVTHYDYTLNEKYWVMAQYSRFIRPGFRFLGVNDDNSLAAYLPSKGTLVIVTTNSGKTDTTVAYDLSRFRHVPASATVYRTSATESLAKLPAVPLAAGHFSAPAPAGSVTTYVLTKIF